MILRRLMVGSVLISMVAGCGSPAITQTVAPMAAAAPTAPILLAATPGKTLLSSPEKALVTAPEKALLTAPEKALIGSDTFKADVTALTALDDDLTTAELSVVKTGFATQGWFSDLKDKVQTWKTKRKLKSEAKKLLKAKQQADLIKYEDKMAKLKVKHTEPTTTTTVLPDGGKEVVITWQTTHEKTSTVTIHQILDDENVEQSKSLTEKGTMAFGKSFETIRSRTLTDEEATTTVYSKHAVTDEDGRTETKEWTTVIKADGSETITGTITNKNGKVTHITGTKAAGGTVTIAPTTAAAVPANVATW